MNVPNLSTMRGILAVGATIAACALGSWPAVVLALAWLVSKDVEVFLQERRAVRVDIKEELRKAHADIAHIKNKVGMK
jgi:hypothetical protein